MSRGNSIYVLLISFVGLLPQVAYTQELTPVMEEFKTVCTQTRDAIGMCDTEALKECREKVYQFNQREIGDLQMIPIDNLQKEMADSLLKRILNEEYIDYVLKHECTDIDYIGSGNFRGNDNAGPVHPECYVCYKGIPARGTMQYEVKGCSNNMRLVVVVAEKENIKLTVTSKLYDGGDVPMQMEVPTEERGVFTYTWKMPPQKNSVIFTFENPNKKGVTCVVALQ